MKTLKFGILGIVFVVGVFVACKKDNTPTTPTTPADVNLKQGLLLYLPFDGNFADSSGNGNPDSLSGTGSGLAADEHGNANQAYGGSGGNGVLLVTNNGSIKFDTAFTVSLNAMTLTSGTGQAFFSITNYATGHGPTLSLGKIVPVISNFDFGVTDSSTGCDAWGNVDTHPINDTSTFTPAVGSWYNIICTYQHGTISTYVNGKLISSKVGTGTAANLCPDSKVIIGGWWSTDPQAINGRLDEVRLYNRVLNADEINELAKDFQE